MLETVAALVERGWRVVVAIPTQGPLVSEATRLGAEVVLTAFPVIRKRLLRSPTALPAFAGGSVTAWYRIGRILARLRPDVVYASTLTVPVWIVRARSRHVPVVAHVHETERHASASVRRLLAIPLLLADRVLFDSDFGRSSLVDAVPSIARNSTVVPVGVQGPSTLHEARMTLDSDLHVAYIGRLSPRKGVDVAIDATSRLVSRGFGVRLEIVGTAFHGYEWYADRLLAQIVSLGLGERVRLHGFRADVWSSFAEADVAVVPSRLGDAFSTAAAEAALAGRPVVVSAIGGLAEAVDGFASALQVPPDDPEALAGALQRIAASWPTFRRTARTFAPIAAQRFSTATYRRTVEAEIAKAARLTTEHALAS